MSIVNPRVLPEYKVQGWQEMNSSRDSPRLKVLCALRDRVCLTMAVARQQIPPETLRSLVDQRFLYQQIVPEKLLTLVDQCFRI